MKSLSKYSVKVSVKVIVALLVIWMLATITGIGGNAYGQSLGDLARQQRAKKKIAPPAPGKVYTNTDIPAATISAAPPADAAADSASDKGDKKDAAKPGTDASKDSKPAGKSDADLEKEYRDKFAKLREDLDLETRKLDVEQRELNLAQMQVYQDPNVALKQGYSRDEINKRTAEIEKQKVAVEKAKQAVADLAEELRTKGLPPGWAR